MSDDAVDIEALADLCTPWCIRVAVTLRIAEHLTDGIHDVEALARAATCNPGVLHSVLTYLAGKGVFVEDPPGKFSLNDAGLGLLETSRFLGLDGVGGRMAYAWGTLPAYVRTGESGYRDLYGLQFWDDLAAHPAIAADFDDLMGEAGHGVADPSIELAGGWEGVLAVVDVGGGTGGMLAELLRARPELRGTLVDLPGTVARAAATFAAAGVADRVTTVGQSFFDPLPAGADLYLLRKVLNDWADPETIVILHRCAEAAKPDGRVVVLGAVVADGTPRPLSIEMVLLGGRTNTLTEFQILAADAGLDVIAAGNQARGYVVECRPVTRS